MMRLADPRFSLAHGGKHGHPFPVPLCGCDETFCVLKSAVEGAKLGSRLGKRRDVQARARERLATGSTFNAGINEERARAHEYGRRSVNRAAKLCDR